MLSLPLVVNVVKCLAVDETIGRNEVSQAEVRPVVEPKDVVISDVAVDVEERLPLRKIGKHWVWNTLKGAQEMITGAREHDAALCFQRFSPFREIDLGVGNHKVWLDETGNLQGWCLSKIPVVKTDLYRFAWLKWKIQDGERLGADPSPLVYGERFPHRLELAEIDKRDNNSYRYSSDFQNHFSPWRLIGATLAALLMLCWGWVNLRQELRSTFGFLTFVVGGGLWVQAASGWLGWSSRL